MSASTRNVHATMGIRRMGATIVAAALAGVLAATVAYGLLAAPKSPTTGAADAPPPAVDPGSNGSGGSNRNRLPQ